MKAANPETIIVFLIAEVKSAFIQMSKLPQPKLTKTQKGKINPKKTGRKHIVKAMRPLFPLRSIFSMF